MRIKLLLATAAVGAVAALAPALAADPGPASCSVTSTVDLGRHSITVTSDACDAETRYENASLLDRIRVVLGDLAPSDAAPQAAPPPEATAPAPPPAAPAGREAPESRPAAEGLRCEISVRPAEPKPRASRQMSEFLARELPEIADMPQPSHDIGILLEAGRATTVTGTATVTSGGSNRITASQGVDAGIGLEPGRKEWVYVLTTDVAPGMVLEGSFEGRDGTVRCEAAVGRPDSRRR